MDDIKSFFDNDYFDDQLQYFGEVEIINNIDQAYLSSSHGYPPPEEAEKKDHEANFNQNHNTETNIPISFDNQDYDTETNSPISFGNQDYDTETNSPISFGNQDYDTETNVPISFDNQNYDTETNVPISFGNQSYDTETNVPISFGNQSHDAENTNYRNNDSQNHNSEVENNFPNQTSSIPPIKGKVLSTKTFKAGLKDSSTKESSKYKLTGEGLEFKNAVKTRCRVSKITKKYLFHIHRRIAGKIGLPINLPRQIKRCYNKYFQEYLDNKEEFLENITPEIKFEIREMENQDTNERNRRKIQKRWS